MIYGPMSERLPRLLLVGKTYNVRDEKGNKTQQRVKIMGGKIEFRCALWVNDVFNRHIVPGEIVKPFYIIPTISVAYHGHIHEINVYWLCFDFWIHIFRHLEAKYLSFESDYE